MNNTPFDAQPLTDLAAAANGTSGPVFSPQAAPVVAITVEGAVGMVASTVVLETAASPTFSGTWQTQATIAHPGGNVTQSATANLKDAYARVRVTAGGPVTKVLRQRFIST